MLELFFTDRVLATLINSALHLDPEARKKLSSLDGRRISIDLGWRERPWIVEIREGELCFVDDTSTLCDVRLKGNLSGFLQLFKKTANTPAPSSRLYIEGDLHAAQQFQRVMGELSPNFDAILRARFGERLGSILADAARHLQTQGEVAKSKLETKLKEFLTTNGCASRSETTSFAQRLNALTTRIERLEKQFATEAH
ncbi:MAG: SCP2 sterol-binding domain-containing protein [Cardiobacteriaceae bacterium]|nr:SCP2 sterol-binding domain-containing protein [Cardiobacteriaceae bacterium]